MVRGFVRFHMNKVCESAQISAQCSARLIILICPGQCLLHPRSLLTSSGPGCVRGGLVWDAHFEVTVALPLQQQGPEAVCTAWCEMMMAPGWETKCKCFVHFVNLKPSVVASVFGSWVAPVSLKSLPDQYSSPPLCWPTLVEILDRLAMGSVGRVRQAVLSGLRWQPFLHVRWWWGAVDESCVGGRLSEVISFSF